MTNNTRAALVPTLVLLAGLVGMASAQSVPDLVNYQGTLLRPDGTAEVGPKTLEFRVVNEASAVVWGPQTFEELPLQQGKFNVLLGSDDDGTTIALAFQGQGDAARYLSVKVAGEASERMPLQRITSVPYAGRAAEADTVGTNGVASEAIQDGAVTAEKMGPKTVYTKPVDIIGTHWKMPGNLLNQRIDLPGLSMTMPVNGQGRPVYVGLRRRQGVTGVNGPGYGFPDLTVIATGMEWIGEIRLQTSIPGGDFSHAYRLGGSYANTNTLDPIFVVSPPAGDKTLNLTWYAVYEQYPDAGESDGFFLDAGLEMYAYEL